MRPTQVCGRTEKLNPVSQPSVAPPILIGAELRPADEEDRDRSGCKSNSQRRWPLSPRNDGLLRSRELRKIPSSLPAIPSTNICCRVWCDVIIARGWLEFKLAELADESTSTTNAITRTASATAGIQEIPLKHQSGGSSVRFCSTQRNSCSEAAKPLIVSEPTPSPALRNKP